MTPTDHPIRPFATAVRRWAGRVRRGLLGRPVEQPDDFFDLHDLRVLNPLLGRHGVPSLTADPTQADRDVTGAARFVLGLLASSPRLRRRFPSALSAGSDGPFARWLTGDGAVRCGLSAAGAANVRAAFASGFGDPGRRVYEYRPDLRSVFPLGLTPRQRGEFLDWVLTHGTAELGVTAEQAVWFLDELDETPDRGLVPTYRLNPDWQARVPHGLTVFGWGELLALLRSDYRLRGPWSDRLPAPRVYGPWDELTLLRQARPDLAATFPRAAAEAGDADAVLDWLGRLRGLPDPGPAWRAELAREVRSGLPATPGVNVLGHFRYQSGLQQAALDAVAALHAAGVRTSLRDLPLEFLRYQTGGGPYHGAELFDVTVAVAAINLRPDAHLFQAGLWPRPGVYRVTVPYWELDRVPDEWADRLAAFDEVWAPSRFIADAVRPCVAVPVVPMLPGVELPPFAPRPRSHFGLPDGRFLFLFGFDMVSPMARKNPLGVIAAFRRAFRPDEPAHLVIKVSHGEARPANVRALLAAAGGNVTVLDRTLSREDTFALLACADCYVSLHRSEGLGLTLAESMLLGKPVIATRYSGNLDFMTDANGYLVDYAPGFVGEDGEHYPRGAPWAEPSVGHAAALMRRVYGHPAEARAVGERARKELSELMSPEAFGKRMAARLAEIRRTPKRERGS